VNSRMRPGVLGGGPHATAWLRCSTVKRPRGIARRRLATATPQRASATSWLSNAASGTTRRKAKRRLDRRSGEFFDGSPQTPP
jgi:hypothetical protein